MPRHPRPGVAGAQVAEAASPPGADGRVALTLSVSMAKAKGQRANAEWQMPNAKGTTNGEWVMPDSDSEPKRGAGGNRREAPAPSAKKRKAGLATRARPPSSSRANLPVHTESETNHA